NPARSAEDLDRIAERDGSAGQDVAVERHLAVEVVHDTLQDREVLDLRVGIVGRHHAAAPQLLEGDDDLADAQAPARPLPLEHAGNAGDDDVRPQPPPV